MENKIIFTACHALTKALILGTKYDYKATFSACLKLYYSNISAFCVVCNNYNLENVSVDIAKLSDAKFDFYQFAKNADFSDDARKALDTCLNFAVNYGLRKRDKLRTISEKNNDIVSDNTAPLTVDQLKRNDLQDMKQEIFLYMYNRFDDPDFMALPNIHKLIISGDMVTQEFYRKQYRINKNTIASFDELMQSGHDIPTIEDFTHCQSEIDSLIDNIVMQIPKIHRETARDIIYSRYIKVASYGIEIKAKEKNINVIAKEMGISVRTVKTIISEIKSVNQNKLYN